MHLYTVFLTHVSPKCLLIHCSHPHVQSLTPHKGVKLSSLEGLSSIPTNVCVPCNEHVEDNVTDHHAKDGPHVEWVFDGEGLAYVVPLESYPVLLPGGYDGSSLAKSSVGQQTESKLASTVEQIYIYVQKMMQYYYNS